MSYKKVFEELSEKLSEEEIAESYIIPEELDKEEKEKVLSEFRRKRLAQIGKRTEKDLIFSDLMSLRIMIQEYIKGEEYSPERSFGNYLEEYIRIVRRTKKEFSEDISIHNTRLSRILNEREEPNIELVYRLEEHSGHLIPAIIWWKLIMKKQEYLIKQDKEKRKLEGLKVKNALKFRA
ncbi:MAG: hypothetical protein R2828_34900 [Saprospiraceae bacterium]